MDLYPLTMICELNIIYVNKEMTKQICIYTYLLILTYINLLLLLNYKLIYIIYYITYIQHTIN